ncbi:PQQ-binding-like beta-propeller repeat protein [Kitasatospora sp. NPDC049285]|uniref:PQQ-binding-like beta-propeller repeat protein n=1 Tax=Kitasatospora sp. NPDC049285 TaxID=3157096 RepID=UPI00341D713E
MAQDPTTPGYDHQQPWYPPPQQQVYGEQQAAYQDPQQQAYGGYQQPGYVDPDTQLYYQQQVYGEQQLYADPQQAYQQPFPQQQGYAEQAYPAQAYQDQAYQQQAYADPNHGYQQHTGYQDPAAQLYTAAAPGQQQAEPAPQTTDPGPVTATDYPQTSAADPFAPGSDGTSTIYQDTADSPAGRRRGGGKPALGRRALAVRVGAGVAALAVLVTAGVLATSGGDDKPTAKGDQGTTQNIAVAHTKAWTAAVDPAAAQGADDTLAGSWLLADTVVRADATGVRAYALADGKPAWTLAPPADGAVPCGLSPTVNPSGLGAVVYRGSADPKSPCSTAVAVDTKTGKAAWSKGFSDAKENYAAHVAVTDDKVIAIGDDKAVAWAAADGKDAWQYAGQGKYCTLSGGAGGATVLLHSSCADSNPVDQAVALNAADGKVKYWRGLNNQPKTVTVLSAEPAVVLTTGAQPADDRVFAWGAEGDPAVEIPLAVEGGGRLDVAHGTFAAVPGVYFHDHTMFTGVVPGGGGSPAAVAAYDLTTGKPQWRTPIAEKGKARPAGVDAGGLLLAVDERLDQPAHLSRFALAGGQETQGGAFPQGTGSLLGAGRVLSGGGHLVAVPEHSTNFGIATGFTSKG